MRNVTSKLSRAAILCTLGLTLVMLPSQMWAQRTIQPSVQFADDPNLDDIPTGLAFDGTYYWSVSGNSKTGIREAQFLADGTFVTDYQPGLDFRSIFPHLPQGSLLAREYADRTIYKQVSFGVFAPALVLRGGTLDDEGSVVLNGSRTEFIATSRGVVTRWDLQGNLIGTVTLTGFGSVPGELSYPSDVRIAALADFYLTYSDGVVSAWNEAGTRVFYVILAGGGVDASGYTFSAANGLVWTEINGTWQGWDLRFADAGH